MKYNNLAKNEYLSVSMTMVIPIIYQSLIPNDLSSSTFYTMFSIS
ncbi:hypothetical protein ROE7235_03398 [Roseibaca ekhonensis]|uniref:Uncharacterized protein n=1 Tax=Roseinatronobacter ekhonensis TaxID=254356 RepID=A0A3B0MCL5_9RHOB|nr:hypothetical protein ROE7235_03398 [Roseibaca ekhonensis]